MSIAPITEKQKSLIVANVVKACSNIEKLNGTGYKFLYLSSGFIAHYNLGGFIGHYREYNLERDIFDNVRMNQWNNFSPTDSNYEYYMSRKDVYNRILRKLEIESLALMNT
jgi:hypothetical protein